MSRKSGRKGRYVSKYGVLSEAAADLLRKKYGMKGPKIRLEFARLRPILNYRLHKRKAYPYTIGLSLYNSRASERYDPELVETDESSPSLVTERKEYEKEGLEVGSLGLKHAGPVEIHQEAGHVGQEIKIEGIECSNETEIGELSSNEGDFNVEELLEEIESMFENKLELEVVQRNEISEKCEESLEPNFDLLEVIETPEGLVEVEDEEDEEE